MDTTLSEPSHRTFSHAAGRRTQPTQPTRRLKKNSASRIRHPTRRRRRCILLLQQAQPCTLVVTAPRSEGSVARLLIYGVIERINLQGAYRSPPWRLSMIARGIVAAVAWLLCTLLRARATGILQAVRPKPTQWRFYSVHSTLRHDVEPCGLRKRRRRNGRSRVWALAVALGASGSRCPRPHHRPLRCARRASHAAYKIFFNYLIILISWWTALHRHVFSVIQHRKHGGCHSPYSSTS